MFCVLFVISLFTANFKKSEHPLSVIIPYFFLLGVVEKCIRNDFYHKNALEMIFTIKMHWKWFLL